MIKLEIDGIKLEVAPGSHLLEAARSLGKEIPTLCYLEGYPHRTSCMLCLVEEKQNGRLLPACCTQAEENMQILTDTPRLRKARKETLEMLLSEHSGDCLAPCQRGCPARLPIPSMLRRIAAGDAAAALKIILTAIPFPAILGRICPAPCEKLCRRGVLDEPVAICKLKQWPADTLLSTADMPESAAATSPPAAVAIIGAGPAGLTAAYYLSKAGYACRIFDDQPAAGGKLYSEIGEKRLPRAILAGEISARLGKLVTFILNTRVGRDLPFTDVRREHAAVLLTTGTPPQEDTPQELFGMRLEGGCIPLTGGPYQTSLEGVFAGGGSTRPLKMAISALAQGRELAETVQLYLQPENAPSPDGSHTPFLSYMPPLSREEVLQLNPGIASAPRLNPEANAGFSPRQAASEAARCLNCDCSALSSCRLRAYSLEYGASARAFSAAEHLPVRRRFTPDGKIVYDEGKCIKCGRCVQITGAGNPGLGFMQRGYATRMDIPFGGNLQEGLGKYAERCIAACPTGALDYYFSKEQ